jgi:glycerol-3-phosphate dehydrogenase (NAD(P)+)
LLRDKNKTANQSDKKDMKFLIMGDGAWGSAFATHLARAGHEVSIWNRPQLEQVGRFDGVFVAIPSYAFTQALSSVRVQSPIWVSLAKGIILETLKTPCETLEEILKEQKIKGRVFTLSGPTHAGTVASGLPCGMILAGRGNLHDLQQQLSTPLMRVYTTHDRRGVELCGALKNSYAVAAGICDGLGLGDNAKAGLLTRALHEMSKIGCKLGGSKKTFYGLAGIGDLMATSYGLWSRNRQLGERVAKGEEAQSVIVSGLTAEGYRTSKGLLSLAHKKHIDAPILEQVVAILHTQRDAKTAMSVLMSRPLKKE